MRRSAPALLTIAALSILAACEPLVIASDAATQRNAENEVPNSVAASPGAPAPPVADEVEPAGNRVAFVGDSLLLQSEVSGKIRPHWETGDPTVLTGQAVAAGWDASVHAVAGQFIQMLRVDIARQSAEGADVIILAGGINDVRVAAEQGDPSVLDYSRSQIAAAVAELATAPCAVVVTMNTDADIWSLRTSGPELNASLVGEAGRYENVHVYDWNAVAQAGDADWMRADGVHLTATGEAEYRAALLAAAGLCR